MTLFGPPHQDLKQYVLKTQHFGQSRELGRVSSGSWLSLWRRGVGLLQAGRLEAPDSGDGVEGDARADEVEG
jgi:hypothetical protein